MKSTLLRAATKRTGPFFCGETVPVWLCYIPCWWALSRRAASTSPWLLSVEERRRRWINPTQHFDTTGKNAKIREIEWSKCPTLKPSVPCPAALFIFYFENSEMKSVDHQKIEFRYSFAPSVKSQKEVANGRSEYKKILLCKNFGKRFSMYPYLV